MHGSAQVNTNDAKYLTQLAIAERRARSRAAAQPSQARVPAAKPIIDLDPSPGTRSITEIAERIDRVAGQGEAADRVISAVRRLTRKAERIAGDGSQISGTGFTIIKRADSPIARLLNSGAIGSAELQSSEDICLAFRAISGVLFLKPLSMERRDRSNSTHDPARVIDAQSRYQAWARLWSDRSKRGDPTLEIVIAAVWDERGFRTIEQDLNIRNGTAAKATAAGLRDYAARAGWAQGSASQRWLVSAGAVFRLRRAA